MISATCGGIGAVQTFSNRHLTVGLDGIVEMSEAFPETLGRTGHDG